MDATPFSHWKLDALTADVVIVYDYTTLDFKPLFDILRAYESYAVVAWSFGVRIAYEFCCFAFDQGLKPVRLTAVNGTFFPVHARYGIHPKVAQITLNKLNNKTLEAFNANMCAEGLADFQAPVRSFDSVKNELAFLLEHFASAADNPLNFNDFIAHVPVRAVVGERDVIFPTRAQITFYKSLNLNFYLTDAPHWSDEILYNEVVHAFE